MYLKRWSSLSLRSARIWWTRRRICACSYNTCGTVAFKKSWVPALWSIGCGRSSCGFLSSEPAKRPDDIADYCLVCSAASVFEHVLTGSASTVGLIDVDFVTIDLARSILRLSVYIIVRECWPFVKFGDLTWCMIDKYQIISVRL